VADQEDVKQLKQGVANWNAWRREGPSEPDLSGAKLSGADLHGANLRCTYLDRADLIDADLGRANLESANLSGANLCAAKLRRTNLIGANLSSANLTGADLRHANLSGAELRGANLFRANLSSADLRHTNSSGADLTRARLFNTVLVDTNLSGVIGLQTCVHDGPSIIEHRTLEKSGPLPLSFLRGVGLSETLIEYLPALFTKAIQHYSCFISYSTKDDEFAHRLHADLQDKGVRCWFAPHDLPIGAKTWDAIDEAIKLRDKLLLILSKNSIDSDWVEDEVQKAFAEERDRKQLVLFPVRIDDAVMETREPWARKLRDQRNIGDFQRWKHHDAYKESSKRLLRDLTITPKGCSTALKSNENFDGSLLEGGAILGWGVEV
jgi:uncharacterized protein YjbI with pentapeptide repeats